MTFTLSLLALPSLVLLAALLAAAITGNRFVAWQILIAIDQLGNALVTGWADETISSRAWRKRKESVAWRRIQVAIDGFFLRVLHQPNHCETAYASERLRLQAPPELRSSAG